MHFEEINIKEVESIISHQDRFIVLDLLKASLHLKVLTILQLVKTHFLWLPMAAAARRPPAIWINKAYFNSTFHSLPHNLKNYFVPR